MENEVLFNQIGKDLEKILHYFKKDSLKSDDNKVYIISNILIENNIEKYTTLELLNMLNEIYFFIKKYIKQKEIIIFIGILMIIRGFIVEKIMLEFLNINENNIFSKDEKNQLIIEGKQDLSIGLDILLKNTNGGSSLIYGEFYSFLLDNYSFSIGCRFLSPLDSVLIIDSLNKLVFSRLESLKVIEKQLNRKKFLFF